MGNNLESLLEEVNGMTANACLYLIAKRLAGAIVNDVESDLVED